MGRGSSKSGTGSLGRGSGENINIQNELDVWSYRHNPDNAPFVDAINGSVRDIADDFPYVMDTLDVVSASELGGVDRMNTLGYYATIDGTGHGTLGMNRNYTDIDKMNRVYDGGDGFHPSRGNKNGTEAVTYHEMGHALTDAVAQRAGLGSFDDAAATVVKNAYKKSGMKGGNMGFAKTISEYATKNYAECVAEAVCDWYCNGSRAKRASKLIINELKSY